MPIPSKASSIIPVTGPGSNVELLAGDGAGITR